MLKTAALVQVADGLAYVAKSAVQSCVDFQPIHLATVRAQHRRPFQQKVLANNPDFFLQKSQQAARRVPARGIYQTVFGNPHLDLGITASEIPHRTWAQGIVQRYIHRPCTHNIGSSVVRLKCFGRARFAIRRNCVVRGAAPSYVLFHQQWRRQPRCLFRFALPGSAR